MTEDFRKWREVRRGVLNFGLLGWVVLSVGWGILDLLCPLLTLLSSDVEQGNAVEIGRCDVVPRVFVDVDEGIVFVRLRLNDPLASLLNVSPNEDLRLVVFGRSCSICGSIALAE